MSESLDSNVWRIQAARTLSRGLAQQPKIAAVLIGGSVSRGWADEYSDLEIGVFWKTSPTDEDRAQILRDFAAERITEFKPFDVSSRRATGTEDNLSVDGLQVDLCHHLASTVTVWADRVVSEADIDLEKQILLSNVQHGIPLHGVDWLDQQRERIADYPDKLGLALLSDNFRFFFRRQNLLAVREDFVPFYSFLAGVHKRLFASIVALNRQYFAGFRRMRQQLEGMDVCIPDFVSRLEACYRIPIADAWESTTEIVENVVQLATSAYEGLDVEEFRRRFGYSRSRLTVPPRRFHQSG